jgi:LacI family transcriptional regulator
VIEETGFVRNTAARQLRGGTSKAIGVVVLDSSNPFFTELIRGAENTLRTQDYVLIVGSTDDSVAREQQYIQLMEEHRIDGLLVAPASNNLAHLQALSRRGVPVVLIDQDPRDSGLCAVTVDDTMGGMLAIRYLLEQGHRKILYVTGPFTISQYEARYKGAMHARDRDERYLSAVVTQYMVSTMSVAKGEDIVQEFIDSKIDATAVLCANDLVAIGILRRLSQSKIEVPRELSVIGYDDIFFASMVSPSLTSIRQPQYELGVAGAQLLLEELSDRSHAPREVRFSPELVIRASTTSYPNPS